MTSPESQSPGTGGAPTANLPVSQRAINETLRTIERRAKLYRNVLVSAAALPLLSVVLAVVLRSGLPLFGFVLFIPLSGAFLILDGRQVQNWQSRIMDLWLSRGLNLADFESTITLHRYVPPQSLAGMLTLLPKIAAGRQPGQLSDEEKAAIISKLLIQARRQERRTLVGITTLTIAAGFLAAALIFRTGALLFGLACSIGLWLLFKRI